jgi:hypothetical protein
VVDKLLLIQNPTHTHTHINLVVYQDDSIWRVWMGHGHDRVQCAPAKLFYRTLWLYENMVKNPSFAPTKSPSSFAKSQPSLTCLIAYHNLPRNQNQVAHVHTSVELYQLLTLIIHNVSLSDIPKLHPRSQQIHIWRRKRTITSQDPLRRHKRHR